VGEAHLRLVKAQPLSYLLSVPTKPTAPAERRPILCFLHGYDEAAPLGIHEALTRHGPLWSGSARQAIEEFIVVAPQLPQAGDLWYQYADQVLQIVTDLHRSHGGDPTRTYLTGFSFGGNGVFDLALAQPETWAALWAVDPTRVPSWNPQRPAWLSVGAAARPATALFIQALALQPAGDALPHGERLYRDDGQGHVGSARSAYADARIYCWLLSKHLPLIP
jgi:predicted peptidase